MGKPKKWQLWIDLGLPFCSIFCSHNQSPFPNERRPTSTEWQSIFFNFDFPRDKLHQILRSLRNIQIILTMGALPPLGHVIAENSVTWIHVTLLSWSLFTLTNSRSSFTSRCPSHSLFIWISQLSQEWGQTKPWLDRLVYFTASRGEWGKGRGQSM